MEKTGPSVSHYAQTKVSWRPTLYSCWGQLFGWVIVVRDKSSSFNCGFHFPFEYTHKCISKHSDIICEKRMVRRRSGNVRWFDWYVFDWHLLSFFFRQQKEPFKKRWFILDSQNRKMFYFKGQLVRAEISSQLRRDTDLACVLPPLSVWTLMFLSWLHDYRMHRSWGSFSSARRAKVTLRECVSPSTPGETSGTTGFWWRRPSGSLSSCVSRRGSRKSGSTPSDRSCTGPCHLRIMPVSTNLMHCVGVSSVVKAWGGNSQPIKPLEVFFC